MIIIELVDMAECYIPYLATGFFLGVITGVIYVIVIIINGILKRLFDR